MRFLVVALSLALCAHALVPSVEFANPLARANRVAKRSASSHARKLGLQAGTSCLILNPTCQAAGGPCNEDLTLLNPWNLCNQNLGCENATSTCQPPSALGATCVADTDCTEDGGLTIEDALLDTICWSGHCTDKKTILPPTGCRSVGDQCSNHGECVNGNCTGGKCLGKPVNATCVWTESGADCAQGTFCYPPNILQGNQTGLCTPYYGTNETSWFITINATLTYYFGTLSCASGYFNMSDPRNPCMPFPQMFAKGVGQRCDYHLDDGSLIGSPGAAGIVSECAQGLYCNSTTATCRELMTASGAVVQEGGQCNMTNGNPTDNNCPQPVKTRPDQYPNTQMTCMCSSRTSTSATCKYQNNDEFYRELYGTFLSPGGARCQSSAKDGVGSCSVPQAYSDQDWESSEDWEGSCRYKKSLCARATYISNVFDSLIGGLLDSYLPVGTTEVCGQEINRNLDPSAYCSSAASVSAFGALMSALAMALWALLN